MQSTTRWAPLAATLAAAAVSLPAAALPVLPFGTLSFVAPTGTVGNTEVVDVVMRLQLDSNSPDLNFSSNPLTGIDASLYPAQGYYNLPTGGSELRDFVSYDGAYLNNGVGCSGNFIGNCVAGTTDYTFDFYGGPGSLIGVSSFNLAAGSTHDFKVGSFTPKAGGAAPGSYTLDYVIVSLAFFGADADGNPLNSSGLTLAQTDSCQGCGFARTVTAVPEPEPAALLLAGLAALGWMARRGKAATR